ncbi:SDR family NAD(P)-dependent oxidoreductase [Kaistia dalseonensis]|uniref:NAD(P)-dependent dehydrogenase (Short-subunit alcohol dehydrogenase family) n=1 Tax=Kaistia dalseonensis TaxID=410840 RepID=A0ABU0HD58_9HYPH|nr:SDR family NAD(P)-dependent oxidoreductase [Kaistia dalseonensis]MCX5497034.1 SDR family NAD(P)-dependent oxidoreductase [Kaistia dalseonensis]MDQ0439660.1 NAD(P)-dependent dehydrogenase (short-subunit alcohol dehydrogenase family) [Kaistia dalseonensis]
MSKTWFVTGATRGIGAEITRAALAAGDSVVATGRDPARIEATFPDGGDRLLAVALDVTSEAQIKAAVAAAAEKFGRIDVLVNNAGYGQLGLFEETAPGDAEQQFATNVFGLFNVTRAVLPLMRQQRSGHIFNLSSIAGLRGGLGGSLYCASKFAIEGFSESLAQEIEPFGISVTVVEPGFFRTDFLDDTSVRLSTAGIADYAEVSAQIRSGYAARNHQQAGDPVKLAGVIVTLAGEEQPPFRYAAGSDAAEVFAAKIARLTAELEATRPLSPQTDGSF